MASGHAVSLAELFGAIKTALGARGVELGFEGPELREWRTGDILHSSAKIDRGVRDLAYRPDVDLMQGINLILDEQYGLAKSE